MGTPAVMIIPPSLADPPAAGMASRLSDQLIRTHTEGTILISVCAGAFVFAETGPLDGRPGPTHSSYENAFRSRNPRVRLETDRLLIDEGTIVTAGGLMSWTDLCLRLIERFYGAAIMAATARYMLVDPPGREQRYYKTFPMSKAHGDAAIAKVQNLIHAAEAKDIPLTMLIAESGLERRTFLRRFRKATGMTSAEYYSAFGYRTHVICCNSPAIPSSRSHGTAAIPTPRPPDVSSPSSSA